jgi:signal transduction histidine kinase
MTTASTKALSSALQQTQAENRVLNRIIEVLCSDEDLELVLSATTDLVLEATGSDACFLHLLDEDSKKIALRAASEPYRHMVGKVELALGEGLAGWVAQHREVVLISDNKFDDPRYKYIPELGGHDYSAVASLPLVSPMGRLVGVVNIHSKTARDFSTEDVAFLQHVGTLVGATIERTMLLDELVRSEQTCQLVVQRSFQAQEDERRRVATEIHDGVTQHLISIWYRMSACERFIEDDVAAARVELEEAKRLINAALDEARIAIYDLRPTTLDDLGLAPALEELANRTLRPDIEVSVATNISGTLPSHMETALYRITQEAFNNIRKHAHAHHVELALNESKEQVSMRITDDGAGFDYATYRDSRPEASFGLLGMTERVDLLGGNLTIESADGKGTSIELRAPISHTLEAPP